MSTSLWKLSDVSLGRKQRLADVTLTVPQGVTAVIGPSGAGKTSLLNLLVGFERPESGRIESRLGGNPNRLPIGWVPPDFGLWPHLTVQEHLESMSSGDVDRLLGAFGLNELSAARIDQLSQGERSRLSVARALASDPEVLVLDEPLVHVDPVHLDDYWGVIREHCRSSKASLVFSTHSPEAVLREAEHVVCLDQGRVVYAGDVERLYRSPPSARLARFLGPANWFDGDARRWLTTEEDIESPVCVRPERLRLDESPQSSFIVQSSCAGPSVTTSEIRNEQTDEVRTVYHRSETGLLKEGARVLLRLCAILLMALGVAGCQQSTAAPALDVVSTRTLKMPVEGSTIPAPRALTVSPEGELYVLDKAGRVLVYSPEGTLNRQWWMPEHEIGKPEGVCVLEDGRVAVADTHYHRVIFFDRMGAVLGMFGEFGEEPGQFIYPVALTRDDAGHLYVAEYGGNDRIQKFTSGGEWLLTMGSNGTEAGRFQRPSGIVWQRNDADSSVTSTPAVQSRRGAPALGTLYVADAINNRVQAFAEDGTFLGIVAGWGGVESSELRVESGSKSAQLSALNSQPSTILLDFPYDITLSPSGDLYIVEFGAGRVTAITTDGQLLGQYGASGRGDGQFWTPWGIAVGGDGRVFVADTGNKRIVELKL